MTETAVVIAPGRGTYNASELGYLHRFHGEHEAGAEIIRAVDGWRTARGLPALAVLDSASRFSVTTHGRGVNAAGLIYAAAMADFMAIGERYQVVAVTGNSMGWYLALAAGGSIDPLAEGVDLVEHMAALMDSEGSGGQLVYPLVDEQWRISAERVQAVQALIARNSAGLFESIRLGGTMVLAGTEDALQIAAEQLTAEDGQPPLRLANHAAFHTPLLAQVSERAQSDFASEVFHPPAVPLIDGRGHVWQRFSDPSALHRYTLGEQITTTYDFSHAIEVAVKEFAPDRLILLGPGSSLGGSVLQILLRLRWGGVTSKAELLERQMRDPLLLAMGIDAQREIAIGASGR